MISVMTTKLESYRRKLETSLAARFYLRFHVALILALSIMCGWLADLGLLKLGVTRMLWRYPLAVLGAYAGFLGGVWLWIEYSGIRDFLRQQKLDELVGEAVTAAPQKTLQPMELIRNTVWVPEGCLILLIVMTPVLFFGGYIFANAALVFSEIVLELLLAAGLIRGLGRVEASGWALGAMNATYWSFMFTLVVSILFAWWAESTFPGVQTIADVITRW